MRAINVDHLRPGFVLGRPLLDERGFVMLNRGVTLTDAYIRSLKTKGFEFVYVRDETDFDVEPEEDISPETRAKALAALKETFDSIGKEVKNLRTESVSAMIEACSSDSIKALTGSKGPLVRIVDTVRTIMDEVLDRSNLAGIATIRSTDSQLLDHSIGVCVVGLMIGRSIGMPERAIRQLAAGCILHDLGMVFVEKNATEVQRVRQHTLLGYELLRHSDTGDILAPHVALEHHEHQDGTGLPRGTRGSNAIERDRTVPPPIPTLIGEVAAVANMYDNLLNGRQGIQEALAPDAALVAMRAAAGSLLNKAVVSAFLRCVPVYPVGAEIIVRSEKYRNYSGIVSQVNLGQLDRPIIVLTRDNRGKVITPITVDLKDEEDITIQCRGYV